MRSAFLRSLVAVFAFTCLVVTSMSAQGRGTITLTSLTPNVFISESKILFDTDAEGSLNVSAFRDPVPHLIDIIAQQPRTGGLPYSVRLFFMAAGENGYLGPGEFQGAVNYTGSKTSNPSIGFAGGCDDGFRGEAGSFTITEASYELRPNTSFNVLRFAASFRMTCTDPGGGEIAGVIDYRNNPEPGNTPYDPTGVPPGTGGGDGGDGPTTPPALPPPPFQVVLPSDLALEPLPLGNDAEHVVPLRTAIDSTFDSDVQLSALSDAAETDEFQVEVSPALIPAPGSGDAQLILRTGPWTRPRIYQVSVLATSGGRTSGTSFLVDVQCTPPSILGINQPVSVSVPNGQQIELEVKPDGTGPLFYQWYKGERGMTRDPVQTANEAKLIMNARETASYWVRVRNACGSVDSNAAQVTANGSLPGPVKRRSRS